jgi:hypothetical protein
MRKLLGITAAAMLLALTGCGGADDVTDDESSGDSTQSTSESTDSSDSTPSESTESTAASAGGDYCDELKQARENFAGFTGGQLNEDTYNQLIEQLETISAVAPADVKDDWENVADTLTKLHDLLASVNITFDDLQNLSAGQVPPGVDPQALQKIAPKVQELSQKMIADSSAEEIQKSAQQDCGLTFN